jgi:predicted tellurium resistance membrane protein TerC
MELLTLENLLNFGILIFLQIVLGFDNLLYISIESRRAPPEQQKNVRKWGILIAVGLRIVLLFLIMLLLEILREPLFSIHIAGIIEGSFNFASLVFSIGGGFLMFTALKEITHMLSVKDLSQEASHKASSSALKVATSIVIMNLIFSFDSILSALAITDVFVILALAIVISGIGMLMLADKVASFIEKNRKYEILGLFILLIVGVVLVGDGTHQAHLHLFGYALEPMSKATFYFALVVLVIVDVLQGRYRRILESKEQ